MTVLYVSYDGILEPLGQSQVLAYLEVLARDRTIHLISFEKPRDLADAEHRNAIARRIAAAGITWRPHVWRNRPRIVSAVMNLLIGIGSVLAISIRSRPSIFHARNILCSAMCLPAVVMTGGKLVSDIRGFWPDERVDAGLIRSGGLVYRTLKWIERIVLRRSAAIVTLTRASVPILHSDPRFGCPKAPITVIPTCVDVQRFVPAIRLAAREHFTLGYIGSFGTWYMLDETVRLFGALLAHRRDARLLIANRNEHEAIGAALARHHVSQDGVELCSVRYSDVPALIDRMDAGVCFVRPQFSKISSAPTKFAEYLACGVPVVATEGVGDLGEIIHEGRVGLLASGFDDRSLDGLAHALLHLVKDPELRSRCRTVAEERFSLSAGVAEYSRIYDELDRRKG